MNNKDIKKLLIKNLPYIMVWYVADKIVWLYRQMNPDAQAVEKVLGVVEYMSYAFRNPLPSIDPIDVGIALAAALLFKLIMWQKEKERKHFRNGVEYGSARWGTAADIAPYMAPDPEDNIILTQTEGVRLNGKPSNTKYTLNKNVLVIGGSGSGKTRFFVKPNLMQMHSSYVDTDPKGTVLIECGKMLQRGKPKQAVKRDSRGRPVLDRHHKVTPLTDKHGHPVYERDKNGKIVYEGYKIKIINTIDFTQSMHYNPLVYVHTEAELMTLVNMLINNTKGEDDKTGQDFWVKAEMLLYEAYLAYILAVAKESEQNFVTLLEMINASETREDDESYRNPVDRLFEDLEAELKTMSKAYVNSVTDPEEHKVVEDKWRFGRFAIRMYRKYKLAAGKTAKSVLISCGTRLAPFDIDEIRELTSFDELELDKIGDRKTALFVIISDTDTTFNFLVGIMYSQLFNLLCKHANECGGKLPIHVRLILDEFANIGRIPDFQNLIATIRSREISACIILQTKSQLKSIYKDKAEDISGNCNSTLFLGGSENTTLKEVSENLGKETIDLFNTSNTKGQSESNGVNYQKTGRDLMTRDELAVMDNGECILTVTGVRSFKSRKYDITKHKRYHLLQDYDDRNSFDIKKFLAHELKVSKQDEDAQISVKTITLPDEKAVSV